MSEVQDITGLVGRLPTQLGTSTKAQGEMDKNDFLKMMLVQLQYQDPLDPMKANEYAAQLAQFTSVEQLQNLNTTQEQGLQTDILLAQSINNTLSSNLIGKEVKASTSGLTLKGGEASSITYDLPQQVKSLTMTISDPNGNLVRVLNKEDLQSGEGEFTWDGRDTYGHEVPDGSYSVQLTAGDDYGNTASLEAYLVGKVQAVKYTSSGAVMVINGQDISFGDVQEIRENEDSDGSLLADMGLGD